MKIAFDPETGKIALAEIGGLYNTIAATTQLRWNKQRQTMEGVATLDTLNALAKIIKLPPHIEAHRQWLIAVRVAIEQAREDENPTPIFKPPVKATLFKHQIRAYNMALLEFGTATPQTEARRRTDGAK